MIITLLGLSLGFSTKVSCQPVCGPKKSEMLKLWRRLYLTTPLAKLPPGGAYLFMKYDFLRQKADIFKEWSVSSLNHICSEVARKEFPKNLPPCIILPV